MTTAEFDRWLLRAAPGERLNYYTSRSSLACARDCNPSLDAFATHVLKASEAGFVMLTQVRLGDGLYAYFAIRTKEIAG